jgi:hypothetical protein
MILTRTVTLAPGDQKSLHDGDCWRYATKVVRTYRFLGIPVYRWTYYAVSRNGHTEILA